MMKPLSLRTIAEVTGGAYIGEPEKLDTRITGVVRDNREVQEGYLFVCIVGERVNGHAYTKGAYEAGAAGCLCQERLSDPAGPYILVDNTLSALKKLAKYYRSLFSIPVIGVIGSVGKTSAKEMTSAVLARHFRVHKTSANLNNELGVPLTVLGLQEETEAAVVEMGISDFGEMSRLADIVRPTAVIMTNIGYCHLENLKNLDGVLKAKSEVFAYMEPSAHAVVCGDDEKLSALVPGVVKHTYGLTAGCDLRAEQVESLGFGGLSCVITDGNERFSVKIPAFGSHMVLAALAAASVGRLLGLTAEEIAAGIGDYRTVGGRANVRQGKTLTVVDDCYNANPNSMSASLRSLAGLSGRKVAVMGDMRELGEDSHALHEKIGALAAELGIDSVLCCGEEAKWMETGYRAANGRGELAYFPEKKLLLEKLPELVKAGDTVLVKASHSLHFEELVEALLAL